MGDVVRAGGRWYCEVARLQRPSLTLPSPKAGHGRAFAEDASVEVPGLSDHVHDVVHDASLGHVCGAFLHPDILCGERFLNWFNHNCMPYWGSACQ